MISSGSGNVKIMQAFKTIAELRQLIKAFELLFNVKPIVEVKGFFTTLDGLHDNDCCFEYKEVSKVTTKAVYFKHHGNTAFTPSDSHCFAQLIKVTSYCKECL